MKDYRKDVILLNEPKSRLFFPEQFSNEIYYSDLSEFSYISYKSNFSIKYIIRGEETYLLDGKRYKAKAGEYLLVNSGRIVETTPECNSEAISIFLNKSLISEVYQSLQKSEADLIDIPEIELKDSPEFFEHAFKEKDILGIQLRNLYKTIRSSEGRIPNINMEFYFSLSEKLILSQKNVLKRIQAVDSVKKSTKEELYRRILLARDYINSNATNAFSLDELSNQCYLSKYHLIRVFKSVFDLTPYQYYLLAKIKRSEELLKDNSLTISEVSDICGFSDIYTFSKTFKRILSFSPSEYRDTRVQLATSDKY